LSYTAAEFGNELIIGGEIDSVDNRYMPFSAVWDGTKWKYGKFVLDAEPFCLYTFKNNLYIGGLFKTADNILVNGIFKWDGKIIHPFDSGIQGSIVSIRGK